MPVALFIGAARWDETERQGNRGQCRAIASHIALGERVILAVGRGQRRVAGLFGCQERVADVGRIPSG